MLVSSSNSVLKVAPKTLDSIGMNFITSKFIHFMLNCIVVITQRAWPDAVPDFSGRFFKLFFNVFWIAVVIEIIVGISEGNKKVQKDERDFIIEAKGLKFGYNILVVSLMIALIQVFITNLVNNYVTESAFMLEVSTIFHFLFIALFFASAAKRVVMIYHYRKDF